MEDKIIKGVVGRPGIIIPIAPKEKLIKPKKTKNIFLTLFLDLRIDYNCTNYRS
jgi:hypothetical protein